MAKYKIIYLLLFTYFVYVSSEEAEKRTISLKPPDKLTLQKSAPYKKEEPGFFSKLRNWFFPTDSLSAEGHHSSPQYLPPYQSQAECHPCNKAPWIPIASNAGHNTLINFVPPSSHLGIFKPPRPQYGPPHIENLNPPSSQYGIPSSQYGPPSTHIEDLNPPSSQYGPPSPQYGSPSTHLENLNPPSSQYGLPSTHIEDFKPPSLQYGVPSSQYGPPPLSNYVAPVSTHLEDLKPPTSHYGSPPQTQYGPPPSPQYGLPPSFKPPRQANPVFRPRPEKLVPISNFKPSSTTHLRPLPQNYVPIGMRPPPLVGSYHSLPTPNSNYYLGPPPPLSDSYGAPLIGANANYQKSPSEQLPLSSKIPIPLPNLSAVPLAPIHNAQNFHDIDNIPQQGSNYEVKANDNVQVIPSVKVADYLASIEHPINVIQSPLVELAVKNEESGGIDQTDVKSENFYKENHNSPKLSENPIVVEDTHTAASAVNVTIQDSNSHDLPKESQSSFRSEELNLNLIKDILLKEETSNQNQNFTPPPMDYSKWTPTWSSVSSSMVPPPNGPTTWLQPIDSSTKKPKQIQIIIPYITNRKPLPFDKNVGRMVPSKSYTTLVPVYTPPSTTEEVWSKYLDYNFAESKKITAIASSTQVYNINDLLKNTKNRYPSEKLPFDVISLQNNIDDWTQQSYSIRDEKMKLVPSKKIPEEFITTPYPETTTDYDHEQAGSNKKETKLEDDIETNLILRETTTETVTTERPSWEKVTVTVSPVTKEKVYIVTPQPYNAKASTPVTAWSHPPRIQTINHTMIPTPKFLVRVDPEDKNSRDKLKDNTGPLTVVFSEWPHLINNLQTTTTQKTPTSKHPLLGLMDLSKYTPPPNATVETISGHSRVVTVVTSSTTTEKIKN